MISVNILQVKHSYIDMISVNILQVKHSYIDMISVNILPLIIALNLFYIEDVNFSIPVKPALVTIQVSIKQ
jgi:hypothetical protein